MTITRRTVLKMAGGAALLQLGPRNAVLADDSVQSGRAFGSTWRLVLPDAREAGRARSIVEAVVARVDAHMSPFRPDSDPGRFNAGGAVVMTAETALVTRAALAMARDSDGAFDPTLAPIGRRFGFGPVNIAPTRPAGRYRDLRVSGNQLTTTCPAVTLDLCGMAKGHALDEIGRALDGLEFLLELGGEVLARGRRSQGRRWQVGIERPGSGMVQRIVAMDARALATSGDAAQSYVVGGRRYTHVMDSRTGAPVDRQVASVSVLADSGLIADGLATAAMVMGPEAARPLLAARGASALYLLRRSRGLEEVDVNGFVAGLP